MASQLHIQRPEVFVDDTRRPVIVAGAGPVGLAVALALVRATIPVVVVDPRPCIPHDPRATTVQPRTLDLLEGWGVLDPLLRRGRIADRLQYWSWPRRTLLAELDLALLAGRTAHPYRLHVPQWEVCSALATPLPGGTVRWRTRVVGFEDCGDHALVELLHEDGARETVRTPWLVGADGASSTVRRLLGVQTTSGPKDVFLTMEADRTLAEAMEPTLGACATLFDGHAWALWMELPETVRLLFHVGRGRRPADAMSDEAVLERLARWLGPRGARSVGVRAIRHRAVYTVQQRVAQTFRVGRAVLAGDAAHTAFPVGGTAMNAGLHDADALARALLDGSERALDAYASERRQAMERRVLSQAAAVHHALGTSSLVGRWSRDRYLRSLRADPARATHHLARSAMLDP